MDLSTKYLGLQLRTPLVASASPLSQEIDGIRSLEDAGASAVVLYSLFEEQLHQEALELELDLNAGTESFAESLTYFPQSGEFHTGPEGYLNHIRKAKDAVDIPIIASLNGATLGGWTKYAKQIEQAGADAIECNIYFIPTNMAVSGSDAELLYTDILREVKTAVHIPVAVKLSPFFSNLANMAKRLDQMGTDGLVLFNRFYQPDIDLEELEIKPNVLLSGPAGFAAASDLDRHSLWPHPGKPGGDQRCAWAPRRNQAAHGRRRCDHDVLGSLAPWNRASSSCGTRRSGVDGSPRI